MAQNSPVCPVGQLHLQVPAFSTGVPPFWHGVSLQVFRLHFANRSEIINNQVVTPILFRSLCIVIAILSVIIVLTLHFYIIICIGKVKNVFVLLYCKSKR